MKSCENCDKSDCPYMSWQQCPRNREAVQETRRDIYGAQADPDEGVQ